MDYLLSANIQAPFQILRVAGFHYVNMKRAHVSTTPSYQLSCTRITIHQVGRIAPRLCFHLEILLAAPRWYSLATHEPPNLSSTPKARASLHLTTPELHPWHQTCNTTKPRSRLSQSFLFFTYSRFSKPQLQATYRSTLIQQHPSQQCLDILLNNMVVLSSTDHLSLTARLRLNKVMDILLNNNL